MNRASSAFIIPHYAAKDQHMLIADTLEGLFCQTDADWIAIIIDDASEKTEAQIFLKELAANYPNKIEIIFLEKNKGPGVCRNIGIARAVQYQCPIIHFNDADDISHPDRVKVVKGIFTDAAYGVVYSNFEVIDEYNQCLSKSQIPGPTLEILEYLAAKQLAGQDIWKTMGTETGYINITSATSVRTHLAHQCPFPPEWASEDFHTWMRLSAYGACYRYTPLIPTQYRILGSNVYQASRVRLGKSIFNQIKIRVDQNGFFQSINLALERKRIQVEDVLPLKIKFYQRLIQSMQREKEIKLVHYLKNKLHELAVSKHFKINKITGANISETDP